MKLLPLILLFLGLCSVGSAAPDSPLCLVVVAGSGMDSIRIPLEGRSIDVETAPQWLSEKRPGRSGRRSVFWRVAATPTGERAWSVRLEFVHFSLARGEVVVERDTGTLQVAEGRLVTAPAWVQARVEAN